MLSLNIEMQTVVQATELPAEEVEQLRHADNKNSDD